MTNGVAALPLDEKEAMRATTPVPTAFAPTPPTMEDKPRLAAADPQGLADPAREDKLGAADPPEQARGSPWLGQ
jgi:hypothetical protein